MSILVSGSAGFIGQRLAERLAWDQDNGKVIGLVHDRNPICEVSYDELTGDILDFNRILEIIVDHEVDYIFHLASKAIVRNCRVDPIGCVRTNVLGTATILEAARQSERVKGILVAESDKSYGPGAVPYHEEQALRPTAIYEASKACVSHLMTAYAENYGLPVASVRMANVYGVGDPNKSRLVPNTIQRLLRGERPQITSGAEEYRREFIYIDDAVEAYVRIMEAAPWGHAINVGSGECHTVREAVDLICEAFGTPGVESEEWARPTTLHEIQDQWLCIDRLREIWPGYQPKTMAETLPSIIEWYRSNQ